MWDLLRIGFFSFVLNAPFYLLCCIPFFPKRRVRKSIIVTSILLTALLVAVYYVLRVAFLPQAGWLDSMVLLLFYAAYLIQYIRYFEISLPKLLYIFLVVQAYSNILNLTAKYVDVRILPEDRHIIAAMLYGLIYLGLLAVTYPLLYRFLNGRMKKALDELPDKSFWMLCITPALFFAINLLYSSLFIQYLFTDGQIFAIYLLVLLTGFTTYFVTLRTALDAAKRAQLEEENHSMERQLTLQAQRYEQMARNIEETRMARHDLRHHLAVMAAYIEQDDKEGLTRYLRAYRENMPEDAEPAVCENYVVDTVVRHYLAQARNAGAALDVRLSLPRELNVPDSDLCIIFGNLFENAANSVTKQREGRKFLTARCSVTHGKLVLTLDNSTDPDDGKKPGVGIASMTALAEKYGGGARFSREEHVFKSSILLSVYRPDPEEEAGAPS